MTPPLPEKIIEQASFLNPLLFCSCSGEMPFRFAEFCRLCGYLFIQLPYP